MPEIPMLRRDGSMHYTVVDDEDFERFGHMRWHLAGGDQYAARCVGPRGRAKRFYLHRLILGIDDPAIHVDHIDGDGLNNRRSNLRVASSRENGQNRTRLPANNTSGYIGVSWNRVSRKWHAKAENRYVGSFVTKDEAVRAVAAYRAEHMPFSPEARQ